MKLFIFSMDVIQRIASGIGLEFKRKITMAQQIEISNLTNSEIDLKQVAVELEKIVDAIFTKIDLGGKLLNIAIMTRASDRVGAAKLSSRWGD